MKVKKVGNIICCILTSLFSLWQGNVKKSEKLLKTANIEGENLDIFWTTWGILTRFWGEMWLMIILKKSESPLLSRKHIFWKTTVVGGKIDSLPLTFLRLNTQEKVAHAGLKPDHPFYYSGFNISYSFLKPIITITCWNLCKSWHKQFLIICIIFGSSSQFLATWMFIKEYVLRFQQSCKRWS